MARCRRNTGGRATHHPGADRQHRGAIPGRTPLELQSTLESAIERLAETGVVKLHDEPVELPYYLSLPVENLNLEQAKQSMADDGH